MIVPFITRGVLLTQGKLRSYSPHLFLQRNAATSATAVEEIEKKFAVTDAIVQLCNEKAQNRKSIQLCDTYYDNRDYELTTKDMWLRERNNKWELKAPASLTQSLAKNGIDHYTEYTSLEDILSCIQQHTSFKNIVSLKELNQKSLCSCSFFPFGRISSDRTRYHVALPLTFASQNIQYTQQVYIDIDTVSYDSNFVPSAIAKEMPLQYRIGEIEFVSNTIPSTLSIEEVMRKCFEELKIDTKPVRGKLLEYLFRYHPKHYDALLRSGQLAGKGVV
jgi:hypothetical protein